jgi:hypothetical protein
VGFDGDDRVRAAIGIRHVSVSVPAVLPPFPVKQVPVTVTAAGLKGNGRPPDAITATFELDAVRRPLVKLPAQRHAIGMNFGRKSKGYLGRTGFSWLEEMWSWTFRGIVFGCGSFLACR